MLDTIFEIDSNLGLRGLPAQLVVCGCQHKTTAENQTKDMAEENLCLIKAEENLSRQLWVAGVRVFSRPNRQKFPPVLKAKA